MTAHWRSDNLHFFQDINYLRSKMRYGKPSKFLIFMTLFVLCGQVLATPFLVCRDMVVPPPQSAEEHCAGMMMISEQDSMAMADDPAESGLQSAFDCDFLCQVCRGVSTAELSEPVVLGTQLVLAWTSTGSNPSHASPPPKDHFRPPNYHLI